MAEAIDGELAGLVANLREAALQEMAVSAVKEVLQAALADPAEFKQSMPIF